MLPLDLYGFAVRSEILIYGGWAPPINNTLKIHIVVRDPPTSWVPPYDKYAGVLHFKVPFGSYGVAVWSGTLIFGG